MSKLYSSLVITYIISESCISVGRALLSATRPLCTLHRTFLPPNMPATLKEARMILALEALQKDEELSLRAAAKLYNVPASTLRDRRAGRPARRDTTPGVKKLTQLEEEAIVRYIIELCARAFPPRLCGVEDMANQLLRARDAPPVGKLWAHRFVKRQPELRTRYTRRYDY